MNDVSATANCERLKSLLKNIDMQLHAIYVTPVEHVININYNYIQAIEDSRNFQRIY